MTPQRPATAIALAVLDLSAVVAGQMARFPASPPKQLAQFPVAMAHPLLPRAVCSWGMPCGRGCTDAGGDFCDVSAGGLSSPLSFPQPLFPHLSSPLFPPSLVPPLPPPPHTLSLPPLPALHPSLPFTVLEANQVLSVGSGVRSGLDLHHAGQRRDRLLSHGPDVQLGAGVPEFRR